MDKRSVWPGLMVFVSATSGMALLLFLFLQTQGLSWANFWIALGMLVPASVAVGYVLLSDANEGKRRQDARLEHLTREILHEINLPISTIQSNLQMLQVRTTDPHNQKRISRSQEALGRLHRLYDELSYAIRREFHAIEKERLDLSELVAGRVAIHQEMGRNSFETSLPNVWVVVDRIGLEQVLDNLIENAMKYSEADCSILLAMEGTELSIHDEGIGMDAAQIARIWERYYQGDSHNPGEGIGLALVKRYCDEAGIGIRIESEPESGTTVRLDFAQVIQK
jgi:signal transduction histidine kinase